MEIENSKNNYNELPSKNFINNKNCDEIFKENINNNEKTNCNNKIKSKKIFKKKLNFSKENKKKKRNKIKISKIDDFFKDEIFNILEYWNIVKYEDIDPSTNKFSPLKSVHPNVIWYLNNLLYFNNKLNYKNENLLKNFYYQIEKLDDLKIESTKINYSLIKQILNNDKIINSKSFLKNFKNTNKFENFNLFKDIKFIYNFNKLKKNIINISETNNYKKTPIDFVINNLIQKTKNTTQNINRKFLNLEKESKLNFEIESKFWINHINKNDQIYNLTKEEDDYINFMEKKINNNIPKKIWKEKYYCHICNNSENNWKNELIFCSFCNISIHIKCYSLNTIPKEENWICQVCIEFGDLGKYVPCSLCPLRGGVLKKTTLKIDSNFFEKKNTYYQNYLLNSRKNFKIKYNDHIKNQIKNKLDMNNKIEKELFYDYLNEEEYNLANEKNIISSKIWAHLSCSYWTPEMHINGKNINEILGIVYIDKKRFEIPCEICNQCNGATIKCNNNNCSKYFHVECARRNNYYLEIYSFNGKKFNIYCHSHIPFQLKDLLNLREKITKEEMEKFGSHLLKYLKENNLLKEKLEKPEKKLEEKSNIIKIEKKEIKFETEELVNFLNTEQILFLNRIKNYIFDHPKNCFKLKLKKNKIIEVIKPQKNFLNQNIGKIYDIFGKYAIKYNFKFDNIYKFYISIINCLKNLESKENIKKILYFKKNYEEKMLKFNNYSINNNSEYQQNNCICNKKWTGELMIECQKCKFWFHPHCQNININSLNIKQINFNCFICLENMI